MEARCQFLFPFSIRPGQERALKRRLAQEGYSRYVPDQQKQRERRLQSYFLPHVQRVLFPRGEEEPGFHQYTRPAGLDCLLQTPHMRIPFRLHSLDVVIAPFGLGFVTLRTALDAETYTEALHFAGQFRVLETLAHGDDSPIVHHQDRRFATVEDFLFQCAAPFLETFLCSREEAGRFQTLPFFVDERMFVISYFLFPDGTQFDAADLFRAGHLHSLDQRGKPFVGASNPAYLQDYRHRHGYDRWAPHTWYVADEQSFACLVTEANEKHPRLARMMEGELYTLVLLTLFQKIALLSFSHRYSRVRFERDDDQIDELVRDITHFSARYVFPETVTEAQGRELFRLLETAFAIEPLYSDVRQTLHSLFQYQEKFSDKRNNYLLLILTIYTVVSGIFGMNLVVPDLEKQVNWATIWGDSPVDHLVSFIMVSGVLIGGGLGLSALFQWLKELRKKR